MNYDSFGHHGDSIAFYNPTDQRAYLITGGIWETYWTGGGCDVFGVPVGEQQRVKDNENKTIGWRQEFEKATIYWEKDNPQNQGAIVNSEMEQIYQRQNGVLSPLGWPQSETKTAVSSCGAQGIHQNFDNGKIYHYTTQIYIEGVIRDYPQTVSMPYGHLFDEYIENGEVLGKLGWPKLTESYKVNHWTYYDFERGNMLIDEGYESRINVTGCQQVLNPHEMEEMNYEKYDITIAYMYDEMITNALGDDIKELKLLNICRTTEDWSTLDLQYRDFCERQKAEGKDYELKPFILFGNLVCPNLCKWDHKPKIDELLNLKGKNDYYFPIRGDTKHEYFYDIWSNVHYGYVGRGAGFSQEELIEGGSVPLLADRDDEGDQITMQIGIDLWETYGLEITTQEITNLIVYEMTKYHNRVWEEYDKEKDAYDTGESSIIPTEPDIQLFIPSSEPGEEQGNWR